MRSRRAFPDSAFSFLASTLSPELVIFLRLCLHNSRIQIFISQIRCNNKLVYTFLNGFMLTVGTCEFLCWRFSRRLCGLPGRDNHKDHSKQFQGCSGDPEGWLKRVGSQAINLQANKYSGDSGSGSSLFRVLLSKRTPQNISSSSYNFLASSSFGARPSHI